MRRAHTERGPVRFTRPVRPRAGFTLVELLVVVMILAILLAIGIPMYLSSVAAAQRATCRSNMQAIATAERTYQQADTNHNLLAIVAGSDLVAAGLADLGVSPTCPDGGQYSVLLTGNTADGRAVPVGSFAVQCSIGSHGSFIPGVDRE